VGEVGAGAELEGVRARAAPGAEMTFWRPREPGEGSAASDSAEGNDPAGARAPGMPLTLALPAPAGALRPACALPGAAVADAAVVKREWEWRRCRKAGGWASEWRRSMAARLWLVPEKAWPRALRQELYDSLEWRLRACESVSVHEASVSAIQWGQG
jgi:hypothetical protein